MDASDAPPAGTARGSVLDGQLDSELQLHLELETDRLVRAGAGRTEARTAALRSFGGVERVREECRDARRVAWADALARNVRAAVRMVRRQPGYALAVIGTLGLGIGANTAMFSLVNGVLLKPLPYADAERLVLVRQSAPLVGQDEVGVSIRELYDYREAPDRLQRAGGVPPDVVRPHRTRRSRPRRHRCRVGQLLQRARHPADARPIVRSRRRRPWRPGGADPQPLVLAITLRRRSRTSSAACSR